MIEIRDVRLRVLRGAIDEPIRMSFSSLNHRQMALVEVEATDGVVGYGESWINYPPWAWRERLATIREGIAPLVVGRRLTNVRELVGELRTRLDPYARQWGAKGPIWQAISGVETALWDLLGRVRETPLSELLGGAVRERVPLYASGLDGSNLAALGRKCLEEGFGALKLRVGFDREADIDAIQRATELLEDSGELYLDANQAWSLGEATDVLADVSARRVRWIEEPIEGNALGSLELFFHMTGLPVAVGENFYGVEEFLPYMHSPAVGALQPDVSKVGGVSEMVTICSVAEALGKSVVPHWYGGAVALAATVQVAAAHQAIDRVEFDVRTNPFRDGILARSLQVEGGAIAVPDGPGLGIELDHAALKEYEEAGDE